MGNDKETKRKLLESAKAEFLEKGYMKASLRSICSKAGVTTGALYFFFKDKQELFESLVKDIADGMVYIIKQYYAAELLMVGADSSEDAEKIAQNEYSDDLAVSKMIIHYMYDNRDEFRLLVEKSEGSGFEGYLDSLIDITQRHVKMYAGEITKRTGIKSYSDVITHLVSHIYVDIFVYIFEHVDTQEEAIHAMEDIIRFIKHDWLVMMEAINKD